GTGASTLTSNYLLKGNGTSAIASSVVYDNGANVGIGTASPQGKLHVIGGRLIVTGGTFGTLRTAPSTASSIIELSPDDTQGEVPNALIYSDNRQGASVLTLDPGTGPMVTIEPTAVGIGTTDPGAKLDVNGDLKVQTISAGSSDYDKFLVSDSGVFKYRTGAQVLSDIGAGTGSVTTVNSGNGMSFTNFTTSGTVTMGTPSSITSTSTNSLTTTSHTHALDSTVYKSGGTDVAVADGGTGASTLTSNYLLKGNGTSAIASSVVYDNGTNVGIGMTPGSYKLDVSGNMRASGYGIFNNSAVVGNTRNYMLYWSGSAGGYLSFPADGKIAMMNANVGIGETNPDLKLEVKGTYALPSTSGTAQNGSLRLSQTSGELVLDMGIGSTAAWLQATVATDLSGKYPILLNPNGGNVGIGTTNPGAKLDILNAGGYELQFNGASGANIYQSTANQDMYFLTASGTGKLQFGTNGTNGRMVLDSNGNVGIGTTSPSAKLDVETSSGGAATIGSSGNSASADYAVAMGYNTTASGSDSTAMGYDTTASGLHSTAMGISTTASGFSSTAMNYNTTASGSGSTAMGYNTTAESYAGFAIGRFNAGGGTASSWVVTDPLFEIGIGTSSSAKANALTVLKNGNVGIGTTNPVVKLDVDGDIAGDLISTGGSYVGYIASTGAGAYKLTRYSSSRRYKENITDFNLGMDVVKKMRPVEFNWKSTGDRDFGFIAEEAEDINPLLVTKINGEIESFKYMAYTAVLTNAIQEQQKKIEELEKRLEELEKRLQIANSK
ncbi:MAG: tail fiber domain-containing protein, partial [Candidatus Omnitrophica bacterium]|nr:tail fiber domain-containing protein [Candidatus Omnitrophota bacterium]